MSGGEEGGGEGGAGAVPAATRAYEATEGSAARAFAGPGEDLAVSGTGVLSEGFEGRSVRSLGGGAGGLLGALVRPIRANPRALYVET
jgi:hypothetical protein